MMGDTIITQVLFEFRKLTRAATKIENEDRVTFAPERVFLNLAAPGHFNDVLYR